MPDLKSPIAIWIKGFLFLGLGFTASVLILLLAPRLSVAVLLVIAIWAFCRFYYFAFYVIQHYLDPGYRFSGLFDFAKYMLGKR